MKTSPHNMIKLYTNILCLEINSKNPYLHSGGRLKTRCQLHVLRNILQMLILIKPTPGTNPWGPEFSFKAPRHSSNTCIEIY